MNEIDQKITQLRNLLVQNHLDGILLQRNSSFSWVTGGLTGWVNSAGSFGEANLLVTAEKVFFITNNIEAPRLHLEMDLEKHGWEIIGFPWQAQGRGIYPLTQDVLLGSDAPFPGSLDLSAEIAWQRSLLCPEEQVRFQVLAQMCAVAVDTTMRSIHPGQTEEEVAVRLAGECLSRQVQPIVALVGSDDRIFSFRHPLPTSKKIDRYAMVVLCGRSHGLVCSITRLVHFGKLPEDLRKKQESVSRIDAALIQNTLPGKTISQVLQEGIKAYASEGYPQEWNNHHQGGPAGYEPREIVATLSSTQLISAGQVYAWNPSVPGMKSEDTILVNKNSQMVLTEISGWPTIKVETPLGILKRPVVLEVL